MPSRIFGAVLCAAVVLSTSACSGASDQSDPNDPSQLEVVTGWTSGSDRQALLDLFDLFSRTAPDIEILDASVAGQPGTVEHALSDRIQAGNPPDSAAISIGSALRTRVRAGELQDLSGLINDVELDDAFGDELLDLVSVEGHPYGIPTAIQRVNVVWWNPEKLRAAQIDPVAPAPDLKSWLADLEALRRAGTEFPLALGNSTTQLQLFESVLIADLGPDQYRALWRADRWQSPEVATAIEHFGELLDYTDPATRSLPIDRVLEEVVAGDAAYLVMSDGALATFLAAGYESGAFRSGPVPGTDGVFDLRADAFVLPIGASHQKAALEWLSVVASEEGQVAFAESKGAVAARIGASFITGSSYQRDAKRSLDVDRIVPSLEAGGAAPPGWTENIAHAVVQFVHDRRQAALFNALIAAADDGLAR